MLRIGFLVFILLISSGCTKEEIRVKLTNIIGEKYTNKILGTPSKPEINLPQIPEVKKDGKSTEVYKWSDPVTSDFSKLTKEKQQQYNYSYIIELFKVTRRSEPEDQDLRKWLNAFDQGASREGIYRALVYDNVYATLENFQDRPSKRMVKYIQDYMERYLNQSVRNILINDFNFFTLKRLVTEKTLEVLDELKKDRKDLEDWYAVWSADIATKFPGIWKSRLRKSKSKAVHKDWAQTASVDHIKGEVVIKLHKLFNNIN
ncbi:MAG: hypothetical protein ACOCUH_00495 [Bacteriovoracia bacterium]